MTGIGSRESLVGKACTCLNNVDRFYYLFTVIRPRTIGSCRALLWGKSVGIRYPGAFTFTLGINGHLGPLVGLQS